MVAPKSHLVRGAVAVAYAAPLALVTWGLWDGATSQEESGRTLRLGHSLHRDHPLHKAPPSPLFPGRDRAVPPGLEALLVQALAKDPKGRPGSARELLGALGRLESEHPRDEESMRRWWEAVPRPAV